MNLRQAAQQALDWLEDDAPTTVDESYKRERQIADALRAALAEPDSDYERGFVDGMNLQTKGSVDKAVNRMAEPRPIQECYGDCPTNPQTCPNPCNFEGRPKPEQNPFGDDAERYARKLREERKAYKALFAERAHGIGEQDE